MLLHTEKNHLIWPLYKIVWPQQTRRSRCLSKNFNGITPKWLNSSSTPKFKVEAQLFPIALKCPWSWNKKIPGKTNKLSWLVEDHLFSPSVHSWAKKKKKSIRKPHTKVWPRLPKLSSKQFTSSLFLKVPDLVHRPTMALIVGRNRR